MVYPPLNTLVVVFFQFASHPLLVCWNLMRNLSRMNRFDALNSSDWHNFSRSSYFSDFCSHSDVIDLLVELFSVGSIPGSTEHEAVRACVTSETARNAIDAMICFQDAGVASISLGYSCCRAYCELFEDYSCDWWRDTVHRSDARGRLIMLCNSLTYPFVQGISPSGTQPGFCAPDVSMAIE